MAENYQVNYEDERFQKVETEKAEAVAELDKTYDGMIQESDKFYQDQIDVSKDWADKQAELQQENTDFAIEKVEQQKEQAQKDYIKEQSGAYADWQKQSDQYGVNAEKMAANGMQGTGFSESTQVSMYNTYQNRVATAREAYTRAVLNYDNAIKDAHLQNNSVLAEIAMEGLEKQLELSLKGFQYKNELVLSKANKRAELENTYYNRSLDVLNQINHENSVAEQIRQFEKSYALQEQQFAETVRQFNQNYQLQLREYEESIRQFDIEIARLKEQDAKEYKMQIEELEMKKQQAEEQKRQFEAEQKLKQQQLEEEKRQYDTSLAWEKELYALKQSESSGKPNSGVDTGLRIEDDSDNIQIVEVSGANNAAKKAAKENVVYSKYGSPEALDYLSALVKSGASKEKVSAEINLALKNGIITKTEATALRNAFTRTSNK